MRHVRWMHVGVCACEQNIHICWDSLSPLSLCRRLFYFGQKRTRVHSNVQSECIIDKSCTRDATSTIHTHDSRMVESDKRALSEIALHLLLFDFHFHLFELERIKTAIFDRSIDIMCALAKHKATNIYGWKDRERSIGVTQEDKTHYT